MLLRRAGDASDAGRGGAARARGAAGWPRRVGCGAAPLGAARPLADPARRRRDRRGARPGRPAGRWPHPRRRCGRSPADSRGCRSPRLCVAFCSTSSTPTPSSLTRPSACEQLLAHQRREAERGLVEQQDLRLRHQRPADRQHLLLAAAHGARELAHALAEARKQGQTRSRLAASCARARRGIGAEQQVLAHAEVGEDAAVLRHQRQARLDDVVRGQRGEVELAEPDARRPACARPCRPAPSGRRTCRRRWRPA